MSKTDKVGAIGRDLALKYCKLQSANGLRTHARLPIYVILNNH